MKKGKQIYCIALNSACGIERQRDFISENKKELQKICDKWNSQMSDEQKTYCKYEVISVR